LIITYEDVKRRCKCRTCGEILRKNNKRLILEYVSKNLIKRDFYCWKCAKGAITSEIKKLRDLKKETMSFTKILSFDRKIEKYNKLKGTIK